MSATRGRKGVTLFEVLVVLALLGIAGTILVQALLPALGTTVRGTDRVELQQQAVLAVDRLVADLALTAPAGITLPVGTDPVLFGIHQLEGVTAQGSQEWADQWVVYRYSPSDRTLTRQTWPPAPPTSPPLTPPSTSLASPPTLAALTAIDRSDNGTKRIMVRNLVDFELTSAGGPGIVFPLTVRVELEKPSSGEPQRFEFQRQLTLRNDAQ